MSVSLDESMCIGLVTLEQVAVKRNDLKMTLKKMALGRSRSTVGHAVMTAAVARTKIWELHAVGAVRHHKERSTA